MKNLSITKIYKYIEQNLYTNKFEHIYLYDDITNKSVLEVRLLVDKYNKNVKEHIENCCERKHK